MKRSGECDLTILDKFFDNLPEHVIGTFVLKSTVPIGTQKNIMRDIT